MKREIVLCLVLLMGVTSVLSENSIPKGDTTPTKIWINEQISQMVSALNSVPILYRNYVQPHFDNSVRTLTDSLRQFNLAANLAPFAVAEDNRDKFKTCLVEIRDTMEDVLDFLRKKVSSPVFDYTDSTETRIEADMKSQVDGLKSAIASKSNDTCLLAIGITTNNLYTVYSDYIAGIKRCISSISVSTNNELIGKFNPEHFPALSLLDQLRRSLEATKTQAHINSFVSQFGSLT